MRLLLQHRSRYDYPEPATLGPHVIRLRPATHAKATIETYGLRIAQDCEVRWIQDAFGNHVARLSFRDGTRVNSLELLVEMAVEVRPVNPFDFFIDDDAKNVPFAYQRDARNELVPFLDLTDPATASGALVKKLVAELPAESDTVAFIIEANRLVNSKVRYVIREEAGIFTPEETLQKGYGSCRDSAMLLVTLLRSRGLAARFVSGYLVQLTDEGMIPDAPRGVGSDVVDLHAWAEVYLPGGGWIGLDATSGLLCGEGHIPLACTATPALASPIEGTSSHGAKDVSFSMTVARLGHEPRPTAPYEDSVWEELVQAGDRVDQELVRHGLRLTMGGEPTFNSREHAEAPEWNGEALGPTKLAQGLRLTHELRRRLAPGAAVLMRQGKHYPGESLPRWALDIVGRRDGTVVWRDKLAVREDGSVESARRFAEALAARLGLKEFLISGFEDPWRYLQDEASLPTDVDPLTANLKDPEERKRLARVLDRGLGTDVGYALPLARLDSQWRSEAWTFRRGHMLLIPGDSPMGLRLPLRGLPAAVVPPLPYEEPVVPRDPRRPEDESQQRLASHAPASPVFSVRTALCVEPRDGQIHVFLPPLPTAGDFFALLAQIDAARETTGLDVSLEGYGPPSHPDLYKLAVTPDPGVLEVNLPPTESLRAHAALMETVFAAALHAGLHTEKYLLDGRLAGSGGGHHLTFGGETATASPLLRRPDLLASLITFIQHHPSLSYMFTGLFVGPTSQAPRVDEARHDSLYELEIALRRAFAARNESPPPWLSDSLFRHLLVDVAGNTHRAELCIDKLFDPATPHGRQGLIELRAFEMPPHFRMASAQMALARALLASFAAEPYDNPLVRWGQALHDRFLLPHWMWSDFEDVLAHLEQRGLALPRDAFRPFVDLRCPVVGSLQAGPVALEVRNAIEPWHVLGEEMTSSGTARYVDSSMERIEVRASGLVPERHVVLVNGHVLPLRTTGRAGEAVGGVRFRAWAPPHSLQPHLGIHHPVRLDVLDTWAKRSLGACAYHVWHPEGRGYDAPPLTRFEAAARRAQRFTEEGPLPWPVSPGSTSAHPDAPYSIDLRRYPIDHPAPEPKVAGDA